MVVHRWYASGEMSGHRDQISRVKLSCKKYGISLLKYIFDDSYSRVVRNNFTKRKGCAIHMIQEGLTDSVRLLLGNNNPQNRILLNLTLYPPNESIWIFTHFKLCLADAIHNFKWVKIIQIWQNWGQVFPNIAYWCHILSSTCLKGGA